MKNFLKSNKNLIFLILIVLLASFFRLFGLNWDQGQHLHPDERFLTMVVSAFKLPANLPDYLNPKISTMNPYNVGFSFYVYGNFPLNITKIIGEITKNVDYWNIHFIGRRLSAIFDIGVVFLLYLIGKKISDEKASLFSAFLYSIMVLPIQLSHFFAVDTFLNFFIFLSFFFLVSLLNTKYFIPKTILLGISFGFALGSKISALYFLPIIGLGFLFFLKKEIFSREKNKISKIILVSIGGFCFLLTSIFFFRLNQPQAFETGNFLNWEINYQFQKNLKELKSFNDPNSTFPPSIQWKSTTPILFPLKNMILWGLGLPLGGVVALAISFTIYQILKKQKKFSSFKFGGLLALLWIFGLFFYQGIQFCKTMRYFFPIYPFLALLSGNFLNNFFNRIKSKKLKLILMVGLSSILLVYPLSFMHIYTHPITRVSTSKWIYENIPEGSTVTYEEWDDGLPLGLPNYPPLNLKSESLFMYDFDTPEKWQKLNEKLAKVDYYFITSNRAYGSTMKLPDKYPQTTAFYRSLFDGTGNFKKVAEFTSYPCFPPFGDKHLFCFNDDSAEEAFTVYDHPKVMIFSKKGK